MRVTTRLTDSPACLVADEDGMSTQPRAHAEGRPARTRRTSKPILEINPEHPLVQAAEDEADEHVRRLAHILFDQAMLAEGGQLDDPAAFVKRVNALLV